MHIEIQVALNFVISYLYNKLPRRRVNIFGEELEKALREKFQGHWYLDKPFRGSAYRCLKTGGAIDSVLDRAARESGIPVTDILENLPNELSVWIDPGEVSFRVSEKGTVKILYSEAYDNHEENNSADCEVTSTFNPEAQCFRPIDAVNSSMTNLSLSPKLMPQAGSSPHSASSGSPTYKGSPNPTVAGQSASGGSNATAAAAYLQRAAQAPLTFTTATFAQTKFGSTKLKTNSKRTNSSSYRMSPTEFSNYIKQRAMQQQSLHHTHGNFTALDAVSPARSLSPNPLALGISQAASSADPFYYPNVPMAVYAPYNNGQQLRNPYETHFNAADWSSNTSASGNKFSPFMEPCYFNTGPMPATQHVSNIERTNNCDSPFGMDIDSNQRAAAFADEFVNESSPHIDNALESSPECSPLATPTVGVVPAMTAAAAAAAAAGNDSDSSASGSSSTNNNNNTKLIDGLNSFYANGSSYQQLLVAN